MRGIVNQPSNERAKADVNALVIRPLNKYQVLDVDRAVFGFPVQGIDIWYKLTNGNYVWSGAVTLHPDCSALDPIDQKHYLLCFRRIHSNGKPDLDCKLPPDKIYYAPLDLGQDDDVAVGEVDYDAFVAEFMSSLALIPPSRKHVFIYVHGYQLFPSLKIDLLQNFVMSYLTEGADKIAKVIFLTWPAFDFGRRVVDDRALVCGQKFATSGHLALLQKLKAALTASGRHLNLIVHSFGHQFLNGILNTDAARNVNQTIFNSVFLMASDVTQHCMDAGGIVLDNYYNLGIEKQKYAYAPLMSLTDQTFVFYDKYDYLLHSSSKKFVPDTAAAVMDSYKNLGNYGKRLLPHPLAQPQYIDISTLVNDDHLEEDLIDFPFQKPRARPIREMDRVLTEGDYDGICDLRVILNAQRFGDRHRYLFTCRQVVKEVVRQLPA